MVNLAPTGLGDTIYAEATMGGAAGIAIVRISGPSAGEILCDLAGKIPQPRLASHLKLRFPSSSEVIDHGLVLWFPGPRSFTGEDIVEFQVHGGRAVIQSLFGAIQEYPRVRLAEPGEFSRRAFVNGKLDLTAAEALADLVASETEAQRRQAIRQLSGELGDLYELWRQRLLRDLSRVEAQLDFVEEGLPPGLLETVQTDINQLLVDLNGHLDDGRQGEIVRQGFRLVIAGAPNVGKSSLMNELCGKDMSIVYPSEGTTRDVVEGKTSFSGYPVTICDTAGIRVSSEEVEQEGIRRAKIAVGSADILLLVIDVAEYPDLESETLALMRQPGCVVFNKIDKSNAKIPASINGFTACGLSCRTGEGIPELIELLKAEITKLVSNSGSPVLTRDRHRDALMRCRGSLEGALKVSDLELIAEELRAASNALGRITGRVGVEDILDLIFAEFCIGK